MVLVPAIFMCICSFMTQNDLLRLFYDPKWPLEPVWGDLRSWNIETTCYFYLHTVCEPVSGGGGESKGPGNEWHTSHAGWDEGVQALCRILWNSWVGHCTDTCIYGHVAEMKPHFLGLRLFWHRFVFFRVPQVRKRKPARRHIGERHRQEKTETMLHLFYQKS